MGRKRDDVDPRDLVFPFGDAVALTRQLAVRQQTGQIRGLRFGVDLIDERLNPPGPGQLVLVLGRPQSGKSLVMQYLVYQAVRDIIARDAYNEAAVFITWEQSVEEATAYWLSVAGERVSATKLLRGQLSGEQWRDVDAAAVKVAGWPLYLIGHSVQRSRDGRRTRPFLAPSVVARALDHIMNERGLEPRVIAMDYLQRISGAGADRFAHYSRCVDWAKDTALQAGCPVLLGSQARREVDDRRAPQIPGLRDSEGSANAEQSSDYVWSLWMPKMNAMPGQPVGNIPGYDGLRCDPRLLIFKVAKQKNGESPLYFALRVEPERLLIEPWQLQDQPKSSRRKVAEESPWEDVEF